MPRDLLFKEMLALTLVGICVMDVRWRRIPNPLLGSLAILGLIRAGVPGSGGQTLLPALLGVVGGIGLLSWQYAKGLVGAADVKLLGALGAWAGPGGIWRVFVLASLLGGLVSAFRLLRMSKAFRRDVFRNLASAAKLRGLPVPEPSDISRPRGIPYGVPIALAAALVLLAGGRT